MTGADLKHLDEKMKKHSVCKLHLEKEMDLTMLGQVDIRLHTIGQCIVSVSIRKEHGWEQVDTVRIN